MSSNLMHMWMQRFVKQSLHSPSVSLLMLEVHQTFPRCFGTAVRVLHQHGSAQLACEVSGNSACERIEVVVTKRWSQSGAVCKGGHMHKMQEVVFTMEQVNLASTISDDAPWLRRSAVQRVHAGLSGFEQSLPSLRAKLRSRSVSCRLQRLNVQSTRCRNVGLHSEHFHAFRERDSYGRIG